jgi:quinol monooxygenase YgiN
MILVDTVVPDFTNMEVAVIATLCFPEGAAARAIPELLAVIDLFRAHEGFIAYDLSQDCARPDILRASELWTTRTCLDRHAAHGDVARWNAVLAKHGVTMQEYAVCSVRGVEVITIP